MQSIKKATFAGGCFWCMIKPFDQFEGVIEVKAGYTGGNTKNPTYEEVCTKKTGHYEAVQITYDENKMKYSKLVDIFFRSIDPTDPEGQFHDKGSSYRTAVFYHDEEQKRIAEAYIEELEKNGRFDKPIVTPVLPAKPFYEAEEYHQNYYKKNPEHYEAYFKGSGRKAFIEKAWSEPKLDPMAYHVMRENGTEPPFQNAYYNHFEEGIYVDKISGKPLFSSKDKFDSGCGWPAFSKPIKEEDVFEKEDFSHGMIRTEVRSADSNAHLGHVFEDGPEKLGGLRYCINSAALRFIPKSRMIEEGYEDYLDWV